MNIGLASLLFGALHRVGSWYKTWHGRQQAQQDPRYAENHIESGVQLGESLLGGNNVISSGVKLFGNVEIGRYTTIGENSVLFGQVSVGRYCQMGPHVAVYAVNHAMDHVTTYNNRMLFNGRLKELVKREPVHIGHDVWIGHGAIVLPGVVVGNGAVIGAGTVVTKDVDDYAVVAGNPGRVIRKRFEENVIALLTKWQWWELDPDELLEYEPFFALNLSKNPGLAQNQLSGFPRCYSESH